MKHKLVSIVLFFAVFIPGISLAQEQENMATVRKAESLSLTDTLMLDYSSDELIEIRHQYQREMERLLAHKDRLRARGIRDMERFIARHSNSPVLDKILVRLAGLYYEEAQREYAIALNSYQDDASAPADSAWGEGTGFDDHEPNIDHSRSIELYQRVIGDFVNSPFVEDALYNKAFLLEEQGDRPQATKTYELLTEKFPDSPYGADALVRVAEYYFDPPVSDIETAVTYYEQVLKHRDSPLYDVALYRLGWAYYRMSDYPTAVSYFTLLADDIDRVKKYDPAVKHHFPAVRDEAIEYIGISFLDLGGAQEAAHYFEQIGGRRYGYEVFTKIGDAYMDVKEEYDEAIQAYEFLLAMYPEDAQAPFIQARIAQAYLRLEDEQMAFASREKLFKAYGSNSAWGKTLTSTEKDKGLALAERSLRENINHLFKMAEENSDSTLYVQAVEESRSYIKAFPLDTSAVLVHWNLALCLDLKLKTLEAAFYEYIKISNLYAGSRFQKQAAKNAIALADEQVRLLLNPSADTTVVAVTKNGLQNRLPEKSERQALSKQDEQLLLALRNYIRNFPHEEDAPKMLAKAGSIYYERGFYRESIRYFKTLAKHFHESPDVTYARFITMESYFGNGDYKSTELLAKKIRTVGTDYDRQANKRLAEAVFLQAKSAADSANHLVAANEYLRVVAEVPAAEFADLALFNAALEFEKSERFVDAIATYENLVQNYPESDHLHSALKNLAFDFREVEDFESAGVTYVRLAAIDTSDDAVKESLYNASVSFVQAKAWKQAINVNNAYAQRFPKADDAADLLFDNASYYLKFGDLVSADEIYERFVQQFPGSPKVIESHYYRGEYFKEFGRPEMARKQFAQAIEKAELFRADSAAVNGFFVAEALFQLAGLDYMKYDEIEFADNLDKQKALKKQLLTDIIGNYTKVISFGTARLPEATYKIGLTYEEFAQSWAKQKIEQTEVNQRIAARNNINNTAAALFDKAIVAYKSGASALGKFIERQQDKSKKEIQNTDEGRPSIADSTLGLAEIWMSRCNDKISESLFAVAELHSASMHELLDAPPPADISELEGLVYQVEVLRKVIAPLAQKVIEVHLRNLEESKTLQLENQWVKRSRETVSVIRNLIPSETDRLSRAALSAYVELVPTFENMIEKDGDGALALAEQIPALLELSTTLAAASASGFKANLESVAQASSGRDSMFTAETEMRLMQCIYSYAILTESLAAIADKRREHYETLFWKTEQIVFEEAYLTFDDAYFALHDGSNELLNFGFAASQFIRDNQEWRKKIGLALLRRNPEEYSQKFGLTIDSRYVPSSTNWLANATYEEGWSTSEFMDGKWHFAHGEESASHLVDATTLSIWCAAIEDSLGNRSREQTATAAISVNASSSCDTVYFRKSFDVSGLLVSAKVHVHFDNPVVLYVNGQVADAEGEVGSEEGVTFELTDHVQQGNNTIAIQAAGKKETTAGLESLLEIQSIADWGRLLEDTTGLTGSGGDKEKSEGAAE